MSEISVQNGSPIGQKRNSFLLDGEKIIAIIPDVTYYNRAARVGKQFSNRTAAIKYRDAIDAGEYNRANIDSMRFKGNQVKKNGNLIVTDKRFMVGKSTTDFSISNLLLSISYDQETVKKEIEYISMNNREALDRLKNSDLKSFFKGKSLDTAEKFGFIPSVSVITKIEIGKYFNNINVTYATLEFKYIEKKYHLRLEPDDYYLPKITVLPPLPAGATKQQIKDRKREKKEQDKNVKSLEKYKELLRKNQGDTIVRKGAAIMIDKKKIVIQKQLLNFILPKKKQQQQSAIVEEVAKRINSGKDYLNNTNQVEQDYMAASRLKRK